MLPNLDGGKFLKIGAYDGITDDPLDFRGNEWSGVFVEPLDYLYFELLANFPEPRYEVINAVVAEKPDQHVPFYFVPQNEDTEHLPKWAYQCGSLNRQHLVAHGFAEYIRTTTVRTTTPYQLARKFDELAVLHIDAEGYDGAIIRGFPFRRLKPAVVVYEQKHLPKEERHATRKRLELFGYTITHSRKDVVACI